MYKKIIVNRQRLILVFALSFLLLTSGVALADAQHLFTGNYSPTVVSDLRYVLSGGDSSYQADIMAAGANQWNGISSNVSLSQNSSGARMSIWKSTTTTDGLFGRAVLYNNQWQQVGTDALWYATDVYIYDNQCNNYNFSNLEKKANVTHEVGHTLSLAHTNDLTTSEVMDQYPDTALSPSTIDEGHLKLKWGN